MIFMRNSLVISALSNWTSIIVNVLTSFVLTPFIIARLGTTGYGICVLVASVVGYYGLLDIGLHSATIRYVARHVGGGDRESLERTVRTSISLFFLLGILVIIISFFAADFLAGFFQIPGEQAAAFRHMVWLVGGAAGLGFPRRIFDAILMAYEKFVELNVLETSLTILRAGAIFWVLAAGWGLEGLGWAELGVEVLNFSCKFTLMNSMREEFHFLAFRIHGATAMALIGFGLLNFVALIGDTLRFNIDSAIIGSFLSLEAVGVYAVAFTLIRLLIRVSNACTVVTFPRLSQLAARDMQEFRRNYMTYSRMTAVLCWGLALGLILLSPGFIRLWVGESFRGAAIIAAILAASLATDYGTTVSINALKALNRLQFFAAQTVLEGIAKAILSIWLVRDFGLIGVAAGTAIPLIINKVVVQPIYTTRIIGIRFRDYFREVVILPPAIAALVGFGIYYSGMIMPGSFLFLSFSGIAVSLIYAAAVVLFYLRPEERERLREGAKKFACYFQTAKKTEVTEEEVL